MDKRRILLMYITRVSGHRQATVALQRALHQLSDNVQAPAVNGFGYTYPLLEKIVNRAYMSVIKSSPKIWEYLYDNPKVFKQTTSIKKFLNKSSHQKIEKLLDRHTPDTIVCTQAFPCGMVADYKVSKGLKTTLIGVLTDFAPHSYWINEGVDYYVVPSEDVKDRLIKKGVNPDIIFPFGIPIQAKFADKLNKHEIFQKLDFDPKLPLILIMGGGQGLGPIKSIVKALSTIDFPFQTVVLTGVNKKVYKSLQKIKKKNPSKKIVLMEYATNVDELMEISSMIITKPGGMTTAECLAKGLPMVIVNPIPGQEMRNADFLVNKGVAIRINDISDIAEEIEILLKSPEKLAAMRQAAKENGKPYAGLDVAKLILFGPQSVQSSAL